MPITVDVQHNGYDLVGLITSAVSAAVAVVGFCWAVKLYWSERGQKQAAERRAEAAEARNRAADQLATRAQAERVSCWVTVSPEPAGAVMRIRNGSELPVTNFEWYNFDGAGVVQPVEVGLLPPGADPPVIHRNASLFPMDRQLTTTVMQPCSFADANNRAWYRHWDGGLILLAEKFDMRLREQARAMARPNWIGLR